MTKEKINKYLERIKYDNIPKIDDVSLIRLQKQHLLIVPFEYLDIHFHKPITLDIESFYEKIVTQKRGGFVMN